MLTKVICVNKQLIITIFVSRKKFLTLKCIPMRNLSRAVGLFILLFPYFLISQHNNSEIPTSINENGAAPDESAILDLQSSNKGLLIPRMPFCDIELIENPAEGLMVFDTEYKCLRIYIQNSWDCLYESKGPLGKNYNLTGWSNTPLDEGFDTDIALDSEENIYITTETEDSEIRLIKYDNKANLQWSIFELGRDFQTVEIDNNNDIFVVGTYLSLPFNFNNASITTGLPKSTFIAKLDSDGNVLNLVSLNDSKIGVIAKLDPQGNLFLVHTKYNVGPDETAFLIEKYDTQLDLIWQQSFNMLSPPNQTAISNMAIDDQGDVYVVGNYKNDLGSPVPITDPVDEFNVYVVKFSGPSGGILWNRSIDSSVPISASYVCVNDGFVHVFGSNNVDPLDNAGESFYSKRYRASDGQDRGLSVFDKSIVFISASFSDSTDELLISALERKSIFDYEDQLLVFSLFKNEFIEERSVSFRPGESVYSPDGKTIYGTGNGAQAGNTIIPPTNGESNIVFKIQKN